MSKKVWLAVGSMLFASFASAAPVSYTIDSSQSSLSVGGLLAGGSVSAQTSGSNVTSYSGTILADRGASTIQFLTGSSLDAALQSTNQQPRTDSTPGSQPADYGRTATGQTFGETILEALRDFNFGLESDNPIAVIGTTFNGSDVGMVVNAGASQWLDGTIPGEKDFSTLFSFNTSGTPPTLTNDGTTETRTLPLSATYLYSVQSTGDSSLAFTGTIVATRGVPEPATAGIIAFTAFAMSSRRRARAIIS
jgi:hypothetical protein